MHLDLWHSGKSPAHSSGSSGGGGGHGSASHGKIANRAGAGAGAGANIMPMPLGEGDYEFDRWGDELRAFSEGSVKAGLRGGSSADSNRFACRPDTVVCRACSHHRATNPHSFSRSLNPRADC